VTLDPIESTQNLAVLKLVPRQEDPSVTFLYLWIDLVSYRICRIQSRDIVGNSNEVTLESFAPHSSLDPALFHLEVPPSAKVIGADGRELSAPEIEQLKARISSGK
jgi:outer membrane lipoprotein carrier protein